MLPACLTCLFDARAHTRAFIVDTRRETFILVSSFLLSYQPKTAQLLCRTAASLVKSELVTCTPHYRHDNFYKCPNSAEWYLVPGTVDKI